MDSLTLLLTVAMSIFLRGQTPDKTDLSRLFKGHDGCFVMFDRNKNEYFRYDSSRCAKRFLPASTFKIPHAVIALETGVIPDTNYVIKWDGTNYDIKEWMRDQNLASAIRYSVVWFFQDIARKIGRAGEQHFLDTLCYGNKTIGKEVDMFWLDNSLKISADEQIELLRKLYSDSLSVSKRSMETVKAILPAEVHGKAIMKFKTGMGHSDRFTGWLVGFVERESDVYLFAFNIDGENFEETSALGDSVPREIMSKIGIL